MGAFGDYTIGKTRLTSSVVDNRGDSTSYYDGRSLGNDDFDDSTSGDEVEDTRTPSTTVDHTVEFGDSFSIGGRLGVLVNDNTLIYALGGYSQSKISTRTTVNATSSDFPAYGVDSEANVDLGSSFMETSTSGWRQGYVVGAGVEYAISSNWTLKTEYRHADYGTADSDSGNVYFGDFGSGTESSVSQSDKLTVDSVRVLISYHF